MAVAPLFNTSMATLKAKLRLTGAAQPDALAVIEDAVSQVRIGFYDFVGPDRINAILATPLNDAPTSTEQIIRSKAAVIETKWARMILLRVMPMLFMDASGDTGRVWNEEELTREAGAANEKELARLQEEIDRGLADLRGDDGTPEQLGSLSARTFGPATTPLRPGEAFGLG